MQNPLFHIGMHKTASTWLQQEVFIGSSPYFCPLSKYPKGHSSFARSFIYNQDDQLLNSFDLNRSKILKNYKELSVSFDDPTKIPVVSHERLSGNPHAGAFDAFTIARRMHHSFPEARVLFLIREQQSFILSSYFQYLSAGGSDTLTTYLNKKYDGKRPGFSWDSLKYHLIIEAYQGLFGKPNVLVLPYEILKNDHELFLSLLAKFLDVEMDPTVIDFNQKYNENREPYTTYRLRKSYRNVKPSSLNSRDENVNSINSLFFASSSLVVKKLRSEKMNQTLLNKMCEEISSISQNRYLGSNQRTNALIDVDLGEFGYL